MKNFANVIVEAMGHSCPVIVSSGVGLHDTVTKTKSGLVSERDAESLAASIAWMQDNPIERAQMGQNGKEAVERDFTWHKIAMQMDEVYEDMLCL